ncbi:MAG TPA: glutathione S-transferase N-terminal domain-containing protein [Candidatus Binatia bacterium]|jgi:GST-like protein|nr:glutathione S-transferase N-terminal domain-containing protein [Candidatus Binatia bacterium]
MIQLYTWGTPNGKKVSIMLEEIELPYEVHAINIGQGDQFKPEYLAINPNNKIPSIIDTDGPGGKPLTLFESGAILMYLAEKTAKLWPADLRQRYLVIQWLMFQMGGVGPMFGQANYFFRLEEKVPYAIQRYHKEALRLYGVLEKALGQNEYLAGKYSIADIAAYPWVWRHEMHHVKLEEFSHVKGWYDKLSERPAVKRGMEIPKNRKPCSWFVFVNLHDHISRSRLAL